MIESTKIDYNDKAAFYRELQSEIAGILEPVWFSNLANVSASIMNHLPGLNWAGFYLTSGSELVLGPFQGLPACLRIPFGKGVCGAAATTLQTQLVPDVEAFPGHIACDARSRSELVIPLIQVSGEEKRLIGVMDLDAPTVNRFDERDQKGLEAIARLLVDQTPWPNSFT